MKTHPSLKKQNPTVNFLFYGHRSAIIGCQYGKWKLKTESDKTDIYLYFEEDFSIGDKHLKVENKGGEKWTGEGGTINS